MKTSFENVLRMKSRGLAAVLLIFTFWMGAPSGWAVIPWTFEWDAATETPESKGFSFSNGTNPNTPTPTGLVIPDTGYYTGVTFDGDATTGWTIAFRLRRVDTSDSFGSFFAVFDNDSMTQFNYHANQYYRVITDTGLDYIPAPGGSNQNFLDVQISKLGSTVNIYFAGDDTPVLTYTALASVDPGTIYLGNYSSGSPVSEIGYLNWTTAGAYLPSQMIPEPSVLGLTLGAAIFGAWRLRTRMGRRV